MADSCQHLFNSLCCRLNRNFNWLITSLCCDCYHQLMHCLCMADCADTSRFPDWPINDPVGLLRSVLDAWRLELEKSSQQEQALNTDDAYAILGIPPASDATVCDETVRDCIVIVTVTVVWCR